MEEALCGICAEMCPPAEREMRQRNALVHSLETDRPWSPVPSVSSSENRGSSSNAMASVTASFGNLSLAAANGRQFSGAPRSGASRLGGRVKRLNFESNAPGNSSLPSRRGARKAPLVANPSRMVKEYARSAADKTIRAEDVRPYAVLSATVDYLLNEIVGRTFLDGGEAKSSSRWPTVYAFVADRLRAVRQDARVQRLPPVETMALLERMLSFYIVSPYLFTADGTPPPAPGSKYATNAAVSFDWKLHANELDECFSTWKTIIVDAFDEGREELRAAYLLRHCAHAETLAQFLAWRSEFADEDLARRVGAILLAFRVGNFVAFFRVFRSFGVLLRCALMSFVAEMRMSALETLFAAYSAPNVRIPEDALVEWLAFSSHGDLQQCLDDVSDEPSGASLDEDVASNRPVKFHGRRLKASPACALTWFERHRRFCAVEFGAHWWRARETFKLTQMTDCIVNALN